MRGRGGGGRRACRALLAAVVALALLPATATGAPAQSQMATLAEANGRSERQMQRILADPAAKVGAGNRVYYVDPLPGPAPASLAEPAAAAAAAPYPDAQTFALHSRPGSSKVLYLDFDGHTVTGSGWRGLAGTSSFDAVGFSLDGSPTFGSGEREVVQAVWQRVAEDFAPFDVDVTTEDPGPAAITRSGAADQVYGTRVLITDTSTIADGCGCGGLAYVGVFDEPDSHAAYQPAFVFSRGFSGNAKHLAEAASHEAGHNLNLVHDGTGTTGYYPGHGAWAPIMGVSYSKPLTQWSRGEYPGANNTEDDLARIQASGPALLTDDHGDSAEAATVGGGGPTVRAAGLLGPDDVDVFRVTTASGLATFSVAPAATGPNLDVRLEVRTADGTVVAVDDPPSAYVGYDRATGLGASVSLPPGPGGDHYLFVTGVGAGSPSTGYSEYGSLGRYALTATMNQPTVTLTSSRNPADLGQPMTFTASVTVPPGGGVPTGTVTFLDGETTVCGAVPLTGDEVTCTAALGANGHSITAAYSGDATHSAATSAALAQVVDGDPVTVTVTSSANPSLAGDPVTFQATVAPQPAGGITPTGTVTFQSNASTLCIDVELSAGQATCSATLPVGSPRITAVYRGDARFNAATSPILTQTVQRNLSTASLTTSVNPSVWGQHVLLRATITTPAPGRTPTGTVTFKDGSSTLCGFTLIAGVATCSLLLEVGSHALTAVYSGDASFAGSTSAVVTQTVERSPVSVVVASYRNPSSAGQTVRYQALLFTPPYAAGLPAGTVTLFDGGLPLCVDMAVSASAAECSRALPVGAHPLTAAYSGDSRFFGATSPVMTQEVGLADATVAVSSSANPVPAGDPFTLTATVTPEETDTGTPTGTLTFVDGGRVLCADAPLEGSQAVCPVTLAPGDRAITAVYSGDAGFSRATSSALLQRVQGALATVAVTSSANPTVSRQPITYRAAVSPQGAGATPTGTVTFHDGGVVLCADVTLSAMAATCSSSPTAGSRAITATYSGDARFAGATSPSLIQAVGPAETALAVTSSANPSPLGDPLTLTAAVRVLAPGAGAPGGVVRFSSDPGTILCDAVVNPSGTATCSPSLALGTYRITATLVASNDLLSSTAAVDQVVVPSPGTFVPVVPTRLYDTRFGFDAAFGPFGPGQTRELMVAGGTTPVPVNAGAVVLNVTVTGPTTTSYLKVTPAVGPSATTSNLSFVAGQTIPNLVMTGVGPGGRIHIFNFLGRVHVIVDVVGYYVPAGGATFSAMTPGRLLDTRSGAPVNAGATRDLVVRGGATGVPADATAVVLNTTATRPTAASYLTAWPAGAARPLASNLNFVAGQTIPNLVVVGVGAGGRISLFNAAGTVDVLVDVVGFFTPAGGSRFTPVAPSRVLDTRDGTGGPAGPVGARATREVLVRGGTTGIPEGATAVVLNVTVAFPTAPSYLTVYPSGVARPTASNLNFGAGQIIPNLVVAGVGPGGRISIYNDAGSVHVIGDIVGYMA